MGTVAITALYKATSLWGTVVRTALYTTTSLMGTVAITALYKATSMVGTVPITALIKLPPWWEQGTLLLCIKLPPSWEQWSILPYTKIVSMIRKYHNHKPQTTPWQIKQSNQLSLPQQDDCNTRMDISNVQQNKEQLQTPTMGVTINKKSTATDPAP